MASLGFMVDKSTTSYASLSSLSKYSAEDLKKMLQIVLREHPVVEKKKQRKEKRKAEDPHPVVKKKKQKKEKRQAEDPHPAVEKKKQKKKQKPSDDDDDE